MLKNFQKLNRSDLKEIQGGGPIQLCDIAPVGCPCKVPPGDPCLGGPGGGDPPGDNVGYCHDNQSYIPCNQTCPNGMMPHCVL